jgi:hypothetical protein
MISAADRAALLAFVDREVPQGGVPLGTVSVWLTGSRARGKAKAGSDWDVLVLHPDAPDRDDQLFDVGTAMGIGPDGNPIELVTARPHRLETDHKYFAGCKRYGVRLR